MHQLWPPVIEPKTLTRQVWDSETARALPGMGRALALYGIVQQCDLQELRGIEVLGTVPRILERPDPDMARPTFVAAHVEDYWLHGNAVHLVTARDPYGWPAAVRYYPAHMWSVMEDRDGQPEYRLNGRVVPRGDVVHVQRGVDPAFPYRGLGVVEQHLGTLNRAGLEGAAETASLTDRGMPSVAVIAPNAELTGAEADAVADKWVERFKGTEPKPAIFPKDTQVIPLSWNPTDQQMVQARQMTVKDLANLMNLDGYWLGAEGSSHTYRSPGAMYLSLLRTSLESMLAPFEDVWSFAWRPRGRKVRFDRTALLRDDLSTMVQAFTTGATLFPDPDEPRRYMGFPPLPEQPDPAPPVPTVPPGPAPDDEQDPDPDEVEDDTTEETP